MQYLTPEYNCPNAQNKSIDILIILSQNGYGSHILNKTRACRALRGEEQIWDAIKNITHPSIGRTRLMYACKKGDVAYIKWLIKRNSNPFINDFSNRMAFHYACESGNSEAVQIIIDYMHAYTNYEIPISSIINSETYYDQINYLSLLEYCCFRNFTDIVILLIKYGAVCNVESWNGFTPLCRAVKNGNEEIVTILISSGCAINSKNTLLSTVNPLHIACSEGFLNITKLLLENGADPNLKINHMLPIVLAARNGHTFIIKELIQWGVKLSVEWNQHVEPLIAASSGAHLETVRFIVEEAAKTTDKKSAKQIACEFAHWGIVQEYMYNKK
jgi:ankyrin repeat protein